MVGQGVTTPYQRVDNDDPKKVVFDRDVEDYPADDIRPDSMSTRPDIRQSKQQFRWQKVVLFLTLLVLFGGVFHFWPLGSNGLASTQSKSSVAFVTLLSSTPEQAKNEKDINDDNHFVATRTLAFQLLHDPQTRNRIGAPFIVMTTPEVSQSKIDRLKKDGALIWPIKEPIIPSHYSDFNQTEYSKPWSKLFAWKLTDYERVVYLDNTVMLVHPLDDIFQVPEAAVRDNKRISVVDPELYRPQPSEYLWAPVAEMRQSHNWPPTKEQVHEDLMHAGLYVLKPSVEMFEHFMSVLAVAGQFDASKPDQNFLNHVFRPDRNMPWSRLSNKWCGNHPSYWDVESGAVTIHKKWWEPAVYPETDVIPRWMRAFRWKMEGYFEALDPKFMRS